jgi:hypothetical protein
MINQEMRNNQFNGSKALLGQSVFEDSNQLQQQESYQVSAHLN